MYIFVFPFLSFSIYCINRNVRFATAKMMAEEKHFSCALPHLTASCFSADSK